MLLQKASYLRLPVHIWPEYNFFVNLTDVNVVFNIFILKKIITFTKFTKNIISQIGIMSPVCHSLFERGLYLDYV